MLTLFGVMPALVALVIWWRRLRLAREDLAFFPLAVLLYGVLAYLIGPAIGASMGRLIAYGWPMAWIAAPILLARYFNANNALIQRLAVLQAIAYWPPLLLKEAGVPQVPTDAPSMMRSIMMEESAVTRPIWRAVRYRYSIRTNSPPRAQEAHCCRQSRARLP